MEAIQNINLDWVSELKTYQKNSIETLITEYGEEVAVEKWLSANGPKDNIPFGGVQSNDSKPFLDKFKTEFKKFICNHPDYEEERKKLNMESPVVKAIWISVISAALGFAATLLAPVIAVMLSIVGKMGISAYCAN